MNEMNGDEWDDQIMDIKILRAIHFWSIDYQKSRVVDVVIE